MESGTTEVFGSDSRHQLFSCEDFSMLLCFLTCCLVVGCLAVRNLNIHGMIITILDRQFNAESKHSWNDYHDQQFNAES